MRKAGTCTGASSFGPAGARILPTNHPELTVTVPNNTDNVVPLMWIVEWRKSHFFDNLKAMAAARGISEQEFLAAYERRLPAGEKFGTHSGLGLSISKQIVEAHGGRIVAENRASDDGRILGAVFIVTLPAG